MAENNNTEEAPEATVKTPVEETAEEQTDAETTQAATAATPTDRQTDAETTQAATASAPYYLDGVQDGLIAGLGIGLVLLVIIALLLWWRRRRRRQSSITVRGEHGDLILSRRAIRDLVSQSLHHFGDVTVKNVDVRQEGRGHRIDVDVEAARQSRMRTQRDEMQNRVIEELRDLAGVEETLGVRIHVLSYAGEARPSD